MTDAEKILKVGDVVSGYKLLRKEELDLIKAQFLEFVHEETKARHIHIKTEDKENVFGVAFKTVPQDSTGVAHILEHTALCGSAKYPVRDPFFSMIKRSLNTFMNAFTASDWTMYPFATQNEKDYFNLMEVYLDASFFPNLDELSFMQEGHRFSADEDGNLSYQGVVFNEMKGAMSSQSQVMGRSLLNAIYPDTTYGFNSGGEPADIPRLTHGDLVEFHRVHYHPSNSYFFTYGNLPVEKSLGFISENVLSKFGEIDPGTDVPNQPRWNSPKEVEYTYPADGEKEIEKKSQVAVAWLTSDIQNTFDTLVLALLDQVLMGNSAAPLYKALIDSGLGSSLTDVSGFDADNRDTLFAAGLKNVNPDDADKIEKIIFDVLTQLAENGIEKELIETAIHQFEFHRREVTNSPMPYGLKMFLSIGSTWFHGGDALKVILFDNDLEKIRKESEKGGFFEGYIRKYFLENSHRVKMLLKPDPEKGEKADKNEKLELQEKRKTFTDKDIEDIKAREEELHRLQEEKEDLSCLPSLEISDISREILQSPPERFSEDEKIFYYDKPTSEIFYFTSVMETGHVPTELVPYIPVFSFLISKTGTKKSNYVDFTRKIDAVTGGFGLAPQVRTAVFDNNNTVSSIIFSAKCLERYQADMFGLISELISEYSFKDFERVSSLLLQYRSALESGIVQNGHRLAISLASRNLSDASYLSEIWQGVHQLKLLKDITRKLESPSEKNALLEDLQIKMNRIAELVFNRNNFKVCMVGGEANLNSGEKHLPEFLGSLSPEGDRGVMAEKNLFDNNSNISEAWTTQSSVSFVGTAFKGPQFGSVEAPSFSVVARLLRSNFLHREIREKGGAYGGFSLYNSEEGIFSCGSYRDPHIKRTIDVFEKGGDLLKKGGFTDSEIKEAVLQTASELDRPDTPAVSAKKDFFRRLLSIPDDERVKFKEELLKIDEPKLKKTAEKYFEEGRINENIAVITSQRILENEKSGFGDLVLGENEI